MCCTVTLKQKGKCHDFNNFAKDNIGIETKRIDFNRPGLSSKFHLVDLAGSEMVLF
jgi:hypothetical protein